MWRALLVVSLCASLPLASGCGDDSKNRAATINEFRAGEYRALCDWAARCGLLGKSEVQRCYDDYTVLTDGPVDYSGLVAKGAVTFDAAAAGRCLDAIDALRCGGLDDIPDDCLTAAQGTVPPGAACIVDIECKGGYCTSNKDGCAGTCMAFTAPHAACTSNSECGPDAVCTGSPRQCMARAAVGAVCNGNVPCARGLACLPAASGPPLCGAPALAGAACLDDGSCAAGLYCDAARKLCTAKAGTGTTCTAANQCADGLVCLGLPAGGASGTGTCGPWLGASGACTPGALGCPADMPCNPTSKLCTPRPAIGQPCTGNGTCQSGAYCNTTSRTCEQLVSYGGPCVAQAGGDNPCAIGICEPSAKVCLVLCP